ncbi:hypothetical protein J6590_068078 [Homalodisca vitripennis]|nr:hypothetical protein J6590_068078 [Homalodisca vitripennis]
MDAGRQGLISLSWITDISNHKNIPAFESLWETTATEHSASRNIRPLIRPNIC